MGELLDFFVIYIDPLAIICLWAYSIYEGIRIFSGNEEKSSQSSLSMALKMGVQAVYTPFESIGQRWSKLDRNHEIMVRSQKNKLQNLLSRYGSKLDTSNRIRELLGSLMDKLKIAKGMEPVYQRRLETRKLSPNASQLKISQVLRAYRYCPSL